MRRPARIVLSAAGLLGAMSAALPADSLAAGASTFVSGQKHEVRYNAASGETNRLLVQVSTTSRLVRLTDEGAAISAGPGCESVSPNRVDCRIATRVRLVQVDLGDGDDRATAVTPNGQAAQVDIVGGSGHDYLRGDGPTRFNFAGRDGRDTLIGDDGPDLLRGGLGNDVLDGRADGDRLIGDEGRDVLKGRTGVDRLFGGLGSDKLDARDQPPAADAVVRCGPGLDLATADPVDVQNTTGCETIHL
jgi:Ca2+-binding RTX toxin-like protein